MDLTLTECLREARSVPEFTASGDYALMNFLRDVAMILDLTPVQYHGTVQRVLLNKIQGKAMRALNTLLNPTWLQVINKLKEEFGVRKSYLSLRSDAMNIFPMDLNDLHKKLELILSEMNTKFHLEGEVDNVYSPENNERIIFDVYVTFLDFNVRALLIQKNITSLDHAYSFYTENNILKEIKINGKCNQDSNGVQKWVNRDKKLNYNQNFKINDNSTSSNNDRSYNQNIGNFQNRRNHYNSNGRQNISNNFQNNGNNYNLHGRQNTSNSGNYFQNNGNNTQKISRENVYQQQNNQSTSGNRENIVGNVNTENQDFHMDRIFPTYP